MKRTFLLIVFAVLVAANSFAQVNINYQNDSLLNESYYNQTKSGLLQQKSTYGEEWKVTSSRFLKKSGVMNKMKLDSLCNYFYDDLTKQLYLTSKEVFAYNTIGDLISLSSYIWNYQDNKHIGNKKEEWNRDSVENKVFYSSFVWDYWESCWIFDTKSEYEYDVNGYLIDLISYEWHSGLEKFLNIRRIQFSYNSFGIITSTIKYMWDYNLEKWVQSTKEEWMYDESGSKTGYSYYLWDVANQQWNENSKNAFEIITDGNKIINLDKAWNPDSNKWNNLNQIVSEYDSLGNLIFYTKSSWNMESNIWVGNSKKIFKYDSRGNNILFESFNWNETINDWEYILRLEMEFDENGNKTLNRLSKWSSVVQQLVVNELIEAAYGINNQYTSYVRYFGGTPYAEMKGQSKYEVEYDSLGNKKIQFDFKWNSDSAKFLNDLRSDFTYNNNFRNRIGMHYLWDVDSANYILSGKTDLVYNEKGIITSFTEYMQDSLAIWIPAGKSETDVNTDYKASDLILPSKYENLFEYMRTRNEYFEWEGIWRTSTRHSYYFSELKTTNINDFKFQKLKVYPNPAHEYIIIEPYVSFEKSRFELFDLSGKIILSEQFVGKKTVSLNNIKSGTYIYRCTSQEKVYSGKIVKQ